MKLTRSVVPVLSVIATIGLVSPAFASATQPVTPLAEKEKPDTPEKGAPYRGKVEAVDATAQTLTVDGKLIYTTANTKLTKAGKAITLGDIVVGDAVHGMARLTPEGKTEASTVMVGPSATQK